MLEEELEVASAGPVAEDELEAADALLDEPAEVIAERFGLAGPDRELVIEATGCARSGPPPIQVDE